MTATIGQVQGREAGSRQCSLPFGSVIACGACSCCAYGCRGEQQQAAEQVHGADADSVGE